MKFIKENLKIVIALVIGIIISGVTVYAVTSSTVVFEPQNNSWNVDTVSDALNDLYNHTDPALTPVLLWTNPNPTSAFAAQTIEMDLSEYKYVIVVAITAPNYDYTPRANVILPVNSDYSGFDIPIGATGGSCRRNLNSSTNGIKISAQLACSGNNNYVIPYKIYGIKGELGLDLGISE